MTRAILVAVVLGALQWSSSAQQPAGDGGAAAATTIAALTDTAIREWDSRIDSSLRAGALRRVQAVTDPLVEGRTHERLTQSYYGIPVVGADVTRQFDRGVTVSIFGTVYADIDVNPDPGLDRDSAAGVIGRLAGHPLGPREQPDLVIVPSRSGGYRLAYRARVIALPDVRVLFIDARTGELVFEYSDLQTQTPVVGTAAGVLGDTKKISTERRTAQFRAVDRLRPPMTAGAVFGGTATFDMRGNLDGINPILRGAVSGDANVATDSDNSWTETSVGDAHVYAGWTTDYLFKRFNRRGLDDRFIELWNFVNPVNLADFAIHTTEVRGSLYCNASYIGSGNMIFGVGLPPGVLPPGRQCLALAGGIDVVAHELAHGVTEYTSGLLYLNESGALNEAFSDMVGTGAEFYFQQAGAGAQRADYDLGEDVVRPGGIRSMQSPRQFGDPDHVRLRCCVGALSNDNGGVHINSGIPNQAWFLAIEGGRNETSGLAVQGVGSSNREQIERVFFRAFTLMLPANANFLTARAATIQSARDLYGAGSRPEIAVTQAWDAVGVRPRTVAEVSFWPDPVQASTSAVCTTVPCWDVVTSLLTPGSAHVVDGFDVNFFDANGSATSVSRFLGSDFALIFNDCGPASTRVPADSEACGLVRFSLGGRSSGSVSFVFRGMRADGSRFETASARLSLAARSPQTTSSTFAAPTLMKAP